MFARTRLAVAALAVASLPLTGVFLADNSALGSFPVAQAQTEAPQQPASIPATGNLHVHKRLGLPAEGAEGDGTKIDTPPGSPVNGVQFTVYPVLKADRSGALDLTTQEGWAAAQQVTLGDVYGATGPTDRVGAGQEQSTAGQGTAVFSDLPAGLYLVVEQANPTDAEGNALAPAAPFLVTVPLTNPAGNGWLSDVHVYPKNQATAKPVKTVTDPDTKQPGASVGEQIGFQIDNTIPQITPGNTFNGYMVSDKLPAGLGEPSSVTVTLGEDTLTVDTDYTLSTYQVGDRWVVRVQLRGDTLASLPNRAGQTLRVTVVSKVETSPANGVLENVAWVLPSNPGELPADWDPENPGAFLPGTKSNTTRSVYGQITVNKTDAAGERLNGATFQLHRCTGNEVKTEGPISVGGQTDFTTAAVDGTDGRVVITGIHLANLQNTEDLNSLRDVWEGVGTTFCLVEKKAPEGYSLLPQPFPVALTAASNTTELVTAKADIQNVKTNAGFQLPLTGGRGIWFLIGGGVLLLLLAAAYYLKTRRSSDVES